MPSKLLGMNLALTFDKDEDHLKLC
jgi:hypothetical protein